MKLIESRFFEGERPCFGLTQTRLENVKFYPGESALKHGQQLEIAQCEFMGKYPLWHDNAVRIEKSLFTVYARAAIWYSQQVHMVDTVVDAPKMFREVRQLTLERTRLTQAEECGWNCRDVSLLDVEIHHGDYLFMGSSHIRADGFKLQGNYAFQGTKNVVIQNATLDSKDAFWNSEDVTVIDSVIDGEYLGWHSKNLRLINCTIRGAQPLCYATGLVMENCTMQDSDLCFEYSTVQADLRGHVLSIKNPKGGRIVADSIGQVVLDEHCIAPGTCEVIQREAEMAHA
jgi:hypothetical protein